MRFTACLLLLLANTMAISASPQKRASLIKLDPATVQIAGLELLKPKQPCRNWAWASVVELMLAKQKVTLSQTELILKSNLGELCIETPVDFKAIGKVVDGDYVLDDGSKVQVESVIIGGAPTDVGYLIDSVKQGRPLLMLWRGRPVVLQGLEYDEYIYPNNQRMYEARKLTLLDPLGDKPLVFDKLVDSPSELGGVFEVRVGPVKHWR